MTSHVTLFHGTGGWVVADLAIGIGLVAPFVTLAWFLNLRPIPRVARRGQLVSLEDGTRGVVLGRDATRVSGTMKVRLRLVPHDDKPGDEVWVDVACLTPAEYEGAAA